MAKANYSPKTNVNSNMNKIMASCTLHSMILSQTRKVISGSEN